MAVSLCDFLFLETEFAPTHFKSAKLQNAVKFEGRNAPLV